VPARQAGRRLHDLLLLGGAESGEDVRWPVRRDGARRGADAGAAMAAASGHALGSRLRGASSLPARRLTGGSTASPLPPCRKPFSPFRLQARDFMSSLIAPTHSCARRTAK